MCARSTTAGPFSRRAWSWPLSKSNGEALECKEGGHTRNNEKAPSLQAKTTHASLAGELSGVLNSARPSPLPCLPPVRKGERAAKVRGTASRHGADVSPEASFVRLLVFAGSPRIAAKARGLGRTDQVGGRAGRETCDAFGSLRRASPFFALLVPARMLYIPPLPLPLGASDGDAYRWRGSICDVQIAPHAPGRVLSRSEGGEGAATEARCLSRPPLLALSCSQFWGG